MRYIMQLTMDIKKKISQPLPLLVTRKTSHLACQVMSELLDNKAPIYMANLKGDVQETNMTELLPFAFDDSDL